MSTRQLQSDFGARVSNADEEDSALLQLRRVPVVVRMKLNNARIEIPSERGRPGLLVIGHRDDHIFRLETQIPCRHDEAFALFREGVHLDAVSDGQMESIGIRLKIVGHLIFRWSQVASHRKWKSRQSDRSSRREQFERVPTITPCIADVWIRIQNHERKAASRQMVSDGEPGLASAHDDRLNSFRCVWIVHL